MLKSEWLSSHRGREWLFAALGRAAHHADETRPVHLRRAFQLPRPRITQPRNIRAE